MGNHFSYVKERIIVVKMSRLPRGCSNVCGDLACKMNICRTSFISSFSRFGYLPFWPSGLQLLETAWEKLPSTLRNRLLTLNTPFGEPCCLRTDITLAAVAYLSSHFSPEERPLRLSYADRIYSNPQNPDPNLENFQIGAELLGWEEEGADIEMIFLLLRYLENIGIKNAGIVIGDVAILRKILPSIKSALCDKLAKALVKGSFSEYFQIIEKLGVEDSKITFLRTLPELKGGHEILNRAKELLGNDNLLGTITRMYDSLKNLGFEDQINIDLALTRELDYYSGPIFDIYLPEYGKPVGGGGRYDGLLANYDIIGQAMGFALDLEVIASFSRTKTMPEKALVWSGGLSADSVFPETLSITQTGIDIELSWVRSRNSSMRLAKNRNVSFWIDLANRKVLRFSDNSDISLDRWLGELKC